MEILVFVTTFLFSLRLCVHIDRWAAKRMVMARLNRPKDSLRPVQADSGSNQARQLAKTLGRLAVPRKENEIRAAAATLSHAGFRGQDSLEAFYGIRLGLGMILAFLSFFCLVMLEIYSSQVLVLLVLPFGLGYYLPQVILSQRIKSRRRSIFRELPDTLDLLMVCLRAGLGFDQALYRVCLELETIAPELSREFGIYFLEVRSGLARTTALANLADRNPSKALKAVVTVLNQSAATGTDMVKALKVYTDSMRTQRRQSAEEKGAKLSTKMTLPLVAFILPALMLIILGPVIVNFIEFVGKGI